MKKQEIPKNIWVLFLLIGIGIFSWMYFHESKEENPMYPPDGLMETKEEMAAHEKWMRSIPSFSPKPEDTLNFDFNGERVLFKPGERRKDILADTAYSPKIVIPWGVNWHLETLDSTDVWFKDGDHIWVYPKMKPIDVKKKIAIYRFKSRYPVTIWLD